MSRSENQKLKLLVIKEYLERNTDENHYGLSGSPTQVERIFPPENDVEHEVWTGGDCAQRLRDQLKKWKFI